MSYKSVTLGVSLVPQIFRIFTNGVNYMSVYRTALVALLAFNTIAQRATSASNPPASPLAADARSAPERVASDTPLPGSRCQCGGRGRLGGIQT